MGFVFVTQSFVLGGGLLGIWYGILSARWEPCPAVVTCAA